MMSTWYDRGVYRLTSNGQYWISSNYNSLLENMNVNEGSRPDLKLHDVAKNKCLGCWLKKGYKGFIFK